MGVAPQQSPALPRRSLGSGHSLGAFPPPKQFLFWTLEDQQKRRLIPGLEQSRENRAIQAGPSLPAPGDGQGRSRGLGLAESPDMLVNPGSTGLWSGSLTSQAGRAVQAPAWVAQRPFTAQA